MPGLKHASQTLFDHYGEGEYQKKSVPEEATKTHSAAAKKKNWQNGAPIHHDQGKLHTLRTQKNFFRHKMEEFQRICHGICTEEMSSIASCPVSN